MLSVVEDFNKLKKYNIESILGINNAGIPEVPKKAKLVEAEVEAEVKESDSTNEENLVEQDEQKEEEKKEE